MLAILRTLVVSVLVSVVLSAAGPGQLPRARWLANGLIDAGGTHEPYLFVVRRGGMRLDARQNNEKDRSEETIRRLKENEIDVFHGVLAPGSRSIRSPSGHNAIASRDFPNFR